MSAERGWIGDPQQPLASALEGWIEQHRALGHQVVRVEPGDPRHTRSAESEGHCDCHGISADLDDESIARHRADAARKKTDRDPAKKWAHLTELARQREGEAKGRAEVADLYD